AEIALEPDDAQALRGGLDPQAQQALAGLAAARGARLRGRLVEAVEGDRDAPGGLAGSPAQGELDGAARGVARDQSRQLIGAPHLLAVHREDHVAGRDPRLLRGALRLDLVDEG